MCRAAGSVRFCNIISINTKHLWHIHCFLVPLPDLRMENVLPEKCPVGLHKFRGKVLLPRKLLVVGVFTYPYPSFVWTALLLCPTVALSKYLSLVGGAHIKLEFPLSKYFHLGTKLPALNSAFVNSYIPLFSMCMDRSI